MTQASGDPAFPPTSALPTVAKFERRMRRALSLKAAWRRVIDSVPAILQIVVATTASFAIAHFVLGHEIPVLAVTVTITSLGFNRDARPVRVLRSVLGILLGVALAAGLVAVVGHGPWQLVVVLLVTLVVGRVLSGNPAFAVAAALPAVLVVMLPASTGIPFERVLDAVIGGAVALAVTALIPRNPRRIAAKDAAALFSVLVESTGSIADALRDGDAAAGELALARLRRTQPLVDDWTESLESARAIARISPFLRQTRPELERAAAALAAADHASRHLRLIARRCEFLVRDGARRPALASLISTVGDGIGLLGAEVENLEQAGQARSLLGDLATRLGPDAVPGASVAESAVVLQLRPLVVDLLVATGMDLDAAQARLAALS